MKKSALALLLFALACGKASKKGNAVHSDSVEMSESQFHESLNEKKIQAPVEPVNDVNHPPAAPSNKNDEQSSNIPFKSPGVGVFTTVTGSVNGKTNYNNCTGTLINGNEIITASHCAPDSEKGAQEYCSKMAFTHANEDHTYKCSKVLWSSASLVSAADRNNPRSVYSDVMILQLDAKPQNIKSHSLAKDPVDSREEFKVLAYSPLSTKFANFTNSTLLADLQAHTIHYFFTAYKGCTISDNYVTNYPFRSFNCPIVGGNSGASLFNPRGEIQGIVSGCVEPHQKDCAKGNKGGYFTDVSCIEKVNGQYSWKNGCALTGPVQTTAPLITRASQPTRSR